MTGRLLRLVVATSLLMLLAAPALGHVGIEPAETRPGSGVTVSLRIGHGCDHLPTTSVSVMMPAGVVSVRPFPKPGWDLEVETGSLPRPVDTGSQTVTEGVTKITWSGGSLEDAHTDVFQLRANIYGEAGDRVFFPVLQDCDEGGYAWIEVPAEGQDSHALASPAPGLTLAGAANSHDDPDEAGGADTLTFVALVVGGLGLAVGALALFRRRSA